MPTASLSYHKHAMFTWICPKCGGEVPPAYSECPRCSSEASQPKAEGLESQPAPPVIAPAPQPAAQPPPAPSPSVRGEPPAARTAPANVPRPVPGTRRTWSPALVAGITLLVTGGLLALLYLFVLPRRSGADAGTQPVLEQPAAAGTARSTHPLAKHLEVTGVRLTDVGKGRVRIRYVVVNHSAADLPEMAMEILLISGDRVVFQFPAKLPPLAPYESKDLSASVPTDMKPYELPDWGMLRPQFQLTSEP